jgi:hypothetical protein
MIFSWKIATAHSEWSGLVRHELLRTEILQSLSRKEDIRVGCACQETDNCSFPALPFARLLNYTCGNSYIGFLTTMWYSAPDLQIKRQTETFGS